MYSINCCDIAIALSIANIVQLVFFLNYSLHIKFEKKNKRNDVEIGKKKKQMMILWRFCNY